MVTGGLTQLLRFRLPNSRAFNSHLVLSLSPNRTDCRRGSGQQKPPSFPLAVPTGLNPSRSAVYGATDPIAIPATHLDPAPRGRGCWCLNEAAYIMLSS